MSLMFFSGLAGISTDRPYSLVNTRVPLLIAGMHITPGKGEDIGKFMYTSL